MSGGAPATLASEAWIPHARAIFGHVRDSVVVIDAAGLLVDMNPAARDLYGVHPDGPEHVGDLCDVLCMTTPAGEPVSPDDLPLSRLARHEPFQDVEVRVRRRGEQTSWVGSFTGSPIYDDDGRFVLGVLTARDVTARWEREQQALRSAEHTRGLVERITDGFVCLDARWRFVYVNGTAADVMRRPAADLAGACLWDALPALRGTGIERALRAAMASGRPVHVETDVPDLDAWFELHVYPSPDGLSVFFSDISERKRTEFALRETERRLRLVLTGSGGGFWDVRFHPHDPWGEPAEMFASPRLKEIIGFDEDTFPTSLSAWKARIEPEDLMELQRIVDEHLRSDSRFFEWEYRIRHRDGGLRWILSRGSIQRDADGRPVRWIGVNWDVTERRVAEEARLQLVALVESTDDAIVGLDADGAVRSWNTGAARIFGHPASEVVGRTFVELLAADARDTVGRAIAEGGALRQEEVACVRADGVRIVVAVTVSPILGPRRGVRTAVIARDISERVRVNQQLREAVQELSRSNDDLERFAYVASHDLQEPLRTIESFTELLQRRYAGHLDSEAEQLVRHVVGGTRRMQRMIKGLLAWSRVGRRDRDLTPVHVGEVVAEAVENLQVSLAESGGEVIVGPMPQLRADREQLLHLFQNLIGNALKFRRDEPPRVEIEAVRLDGHLLFSVRDNGIGIAPSEAHRVFEAFSRLHGHDAFPGAGLGLAIAQRIVERHGGRIWVHPSPPPGAVVQFTLAVDPDASAPPAS